MAKATPKLDKTIRAYKDDVRRRLKVLNTILTKAARGDFTTLEEKPSDEFSRLYAGVNVLLRGAQKRIDELNAIQAVEEALIESVGEGLIAVDKDLRVTIVNGQALKLLGLRSRKHLIGRKLEDAMPLEDQAGNPIVGAARPTRTALSLPRGRRISIRRPYYYIRRSDGGRFPASITTAPILLKGVAIGAVSVFRDITEQRRIDEAKSEFISLASHQLRTPLSIISLNLEIVFKHFSQLLEKTEVREHLETIKNASNRMIDLVTELLNVSKIELGNLDIAVHTIDLGALLREGIAAVEALAAKKHIAVRLELPPKPVKIQSDDRLLKIVLDNLLSNAVKYTNRKGSVDVRITPPEDGQVTLSVKDTGCGIPESEQDQVFSKMFRAHNVKRREEGGTGLGLYIARSFVEALGGSISFVSKEGKGTTFTVTLPVRSRASQYVAGEE